MKKTTVIKRASSIFFFIFFLAVIMFSCSKKGSVDCGTGGITTPQSYLFWIDHDFGCGNITVEVRDESGSKLNNIQSTISVYNKAEPSICAGASVINNAIFYLSIGKKFTYHAYCDSKKWDGTIQVSCEQGQCNNIQLK